MPETTTPTTRIRIGDIVYLRSGSPPLVVVSMDEDYDDKTYRVTWMTKDGEIQSDDLDRRIVRKEYCAELDRRFNPETA